MDLQLSIVAYILMPVVLGIVGHIYYTIKTVETHMNQKITEPQVRAMIEDKLEAIRTTNDETSGRVDRIEDRMQRIEDKLDSVIQLLIKK